MKTIYRYPLTIGHNTIKTYQGCEILSAGIDPRGDLSIWILVNTKTEMNKDLNIYVAGTGWDFEPKLQCPYHIATVKQEQNMWHVFSDLEEEWN